MERSVPLASICRTHFAAFRPLGTTRVAEFRFAAPRTARPRRALLAFAAASKMATPKARTRAIRWRWKAWRGVAYDENGWGGAARADRRRRR